MSALTNAKLALGVSLLALGVAVAAVLRSPRSPAARGQYAIVGLSTTAQLRSSRIGIAGSQSRVVYSAGLDRLRPGDVVTVTAQAEVTNPQDYNVFVGSTIVLASSPQAVSGDDFTRGGGGNVTPSMHHAIITSDASLTISAPIRRAWVNLVLTAASSLPRPDDQLTVEPGAGQVTAVVLKSATTG
jgi:hypothetical protein